jgi:hypothetical protein
MNVKKYAKVEGHPHLLRDLSTNAIINTDSIQSQQYIKAKQNKQSEREKIDRIESELNEVKSSLNEIKSMLRNLYES